MKGSGLQPEADAEMDEVLEGEVLDGEEDPELIKTNKLLHMARTFNNPASTSQPSSKAKQASA